MQCVLWCIILGGILLFTCLLICRTLRFTMILLASMGKGWSLAVIRVQAQNLLRWCSFVWVQLQSSLIQPQRKYFSQKLNYAGDILDFCLSAELSLFSCRCSFAKMKDDFKRNGASLGVAFAVGSSLWSGSCILWQGRCVHCYFWGWSEELQRSPRGLPELESEMLICR